MSTLILDELFPGVQFSQNFRILRDLNVSHIRPWIYRNNDLLDGDLQLEILQGSTVLITKTLSYVDINAAFTEDFAHGFLRFDFDSLSLRVNEGNTEEEYTARFSMINHTLAEDNFLGIVRNWDIKIYDTYGDVVSGQGVNDYIEPAGIEIYENR